MKDSPIPRKKRQRKAKRPPNWLGYYPSISQATMTRKALYGTFFKTGSSENQNRTCTSYEKSTN